MPVSFAPKPHLVERLLIVDGLGRSGKKLTCKIVSHLQGVEYFQYQSMIEKIAYMWGLDRLDQNDAARLLQVGTEEIIYNRAIGRNLNTRPSDDTSVSHSPDPDTYFNRSTHPDGAAAVDRFNLEGRVSLFYTHSVAQFIDVLFDAFPYLKFVHVARHPIDIAEDWFRRGWGERQGVDPRVFGLMINTDSEPVPWHAADWPEAYKTMRPAERCVESVVRLQRAADAKLDSLPTDRRHQVHRLAFENLLTDTDVQIAALAGFIDTQPEPKMHDLLAREKCPVSSATKMRAGNLKKLEAECSPDVIERLLEAAGLYERRWSETTKHQPTPTAG